MFTLNPKYVYYFSQKLTSIYCQIFFACKAVLTGFFINQARGQTKNKVKTCEKRQQDIWKMIDDSNNEKLDKIRPIFNFGH